MEDFDPDRPITYTAFLAMMDIVERHILIRVSIVCATMIGCSAIIGWAIWGS